MSDTRIYQLSIGLMIAFALGYLGLSFFEFLPLSPQLSSFSLNTPPELFLPIIQIISTIGFAIATLVAASFALRNFQLAAYISVIFFGLMYLSREVFLLIQMNLGLLDVPFYNFSFLYLGLIMLIEMAVLWVIPRYFQFKMNHQ